MKDRLKEIRERLEKATPGPWLKGSWRGQCKKSHYHGGESCKYDYTLDASAACVSTATENQELIGYDDYGPVLGDNDAEFIAHAREDIPFLLSEIERVTAERDEARKFYGPAGLRAVSSYIDERDRLRQALDHAKKVIDYHAACAPKHLEEVEGIECGKE